MVENIIEDVDDIVHQYCDEDKDKNMLFKRLEKIMPVNFYELPVDQVTPKMLMTTIQVCIWLC